jgi:transposase
VGQPCVGATIYDRAMPVGALLQGARARRGQQPQVKTSGKRKGYKVLGLIEYFTGRLFDQGQEGRLNSATSMAFLKGGRAQTTDPIILMQDGARYHTSAETPAFCTQHAARLQVCQWPTDAPDYNPIEKRWKKIKPHDTPRHSFPTFEALTAKVEQALLKFATIPEELLTLCSLPTALAQAA